MSNQYFNKLNYTMANEDTSYEVSLIGELHSKNILSVGGSGSRCLPFLALDIESLSIVDVSKEQILLIKFKLETIKQLTRKDAIELWTTKNLATRKSMASRLVLGPELISFSQFILNSPIPLLYQGSWEQAFITFSKLTRFFFGHRKINELFITKDRKQFIQKEFDGFKWKSLLKIVGNRAMFNSLLYKGHFIKKNSSLTYFEYYYQAFKRLFLLDIKHSHFLQICFFGEVKYQEGLPIEFSEELFDRIKNSEVKPQYFLGSAFDQNYDQEFDFVSLSDVPSYLSGELERNYIQTLSKNVKQNGIIVNRFYLRKTENTNLEGFSECSNLFSHYAEKELVQMYEIQVLKKL